MRLASITPSSAQEIRDAIVDDIEALAPGARVVATAVPTGDGGTIDLIAADGRGRLAIAVFRLEADAPAICRALEQWDWITANLGLLRALGTAPGLDLSQPPRLLLVAGTVSGAARRAAAHVDHPEVEMIEATLVAVGQARGVLLRRVAAAERPPAAAGIEEVLSALPAGEARSLARRVIEELRDAVEDGTPLVASRLRGGIDLTAGDRHLATLVAASTGIEVRRERSGASRPILTDAQCREEARELADSARLPRVEPRRGEEEMPAAPAEALTPEEIAEFGRPGPATAARLDDEAAPADSEPPPVRILKTGFMEN